MSPPPLADGKASLDPLRSVQFSCVDNAFVQFSSVQFSSAFSIFQTSPRPTATSSLKQDVHHLNCLSRAASFTACTDWAPGPRLAPVRILGEGLRHCARSRGLSAVRRVLCSFPSVLLF